MESLMSPNVVYTEDQIEFIRKNAYGTDSKKLTEMLNQTFNTNYKVSSIAALRYANGFKSYITNHGKRSSIATEFKKGHVPFNKGLKGVHYSPQSEFKIGHRPVNTQPIGTIKMRDDGYLWIKLAETKPSRFGWKQVHRYNYEKKHGLIPPGNKIIFLDGNRNNCEIDNLLLVSAGEHQVMNKLGLRNSNPELTRVGHTVSILIKKTSQLRSKKT